MGRRYQSLLDVHSGTILESGYPSQDELETLTVLNMTTTRSRREGHRDNPINDLIKTLNVSNQSF